MGKILSQEEIDLLLGSAADIERATSNREASRSLPAVAYDFRRPDRVSKEQLRSIHFMHDRFARNLSASLSAYLRTVTEIAIVSVEQFSYSEVLMSLPDPTAFYAISMEPLDGFGALEINPSVAFTMIDRMLGGTGQGIDVSRALTEIEQHVVDAVVKIILENLAETWRSIQEIHFRVHGRETRPQMLQVAAPNEAVLLLVFDLRLGDVRGMLNLCVPAAIIETVGDAFTQSWYRARREPNGTEQVRLRQSLGAMAMGIEAVVQTTLPARELLRLKPGSVLSLGLAASQPVKVKVGRLVKFTGRLVKHGASIGVSVTQGPAAS